MWLLVLLTLVNAAANNDTFLEYRFNLGIAPVNAIDVLLVFGTVFALVRLKSSRNFASEHLHPALKWTLAFFIVGGFCGFIGAAFNGAAAYDVLNISRDYLTLPACVLMGYALVRNPRSTRWALYAYVVGGIITALMILLFFRGQLESGAGERNINMLRTINYVASYAGVGALFLIFCLMVGVRLVPALVALPLAALMVTGQFATLSRSEWVPTTLAFMASLFFLSRGRRAKGVIASVIACVVLGLTLLVGVKLAGHTVDLTFMEKLTQKLESLNPSSDTVKAWDTRVPAAMEEVKLWAENPFFGRGFGKQEVISKTVSSFGDGFHHNAWTSTLCETGLAGLAAFVALFASCIVLGARMIRDHVDRYSVLVGCMGVVGGIFFLIYGACTMSINIERPAIPLGIIAGMVMRARTMQLATLSRRDNYLAMADDDPYLPISVDRDGFVVLADRPELAYEELPVEY